MSNIVPPSLIKARPCTVRGFKNSTDRARVLNSKMHYAQYAICYVAGLCSLINQATYGMIMGISEYV